MEAFPNKDVATEVLSRLTPKTLMAFACTAKRWYSFISDPSFLRIHFKRSNDILGPIMQDTMPFWESDLRFVDLLTLSETECTVKYKILNFLPEKVVLVASSNGILCCRSWVNRDKLTLKKGLELKSSQNGFAIYICNPFTREWAQFRTEGGDDATPFIGFAFYPFCSSLRALSKFKLVNLRRSRSNPDTYSFVIYSFETRKWETSKEVCKFSSRIYPSRVIFANGWLHWLTSDHDLVTFHVEKELSKVMKLPDITLYSLSECTFGMYWGESEDYFHYVFAFKSDLRVWVLKDYKESAWELKHYLNLSEFCKQHSSLLKIIFGETPFTSTDNRTKFKFHPMAFHNDVLYMWIHAGYGAVFLYNFRTKKLVNLHATTQLKNRLYDTPIVFPCRLSLMPLELVSFRARGIKRNRKRKAF